MKTACSPPAGCHRCGGPLKGRRTAYCTKACARLHPIEHSWNQARPAALRRAKYRCQLCGGAERLTRILAGPNAGGVRSSLEVNHKMPLNGGGRSWTCANHPSNLEVLCREPCHRLATAAQRAAGLLGRPRHGVVSSRKPDLEVTT